MGLYFDVYMRIFEGNDHHTDIHSCTIYVHTWSIANGLGLFIDLHNLLFIKYELRVKQILIYTIEFVRKIYDGLCNNNY